jgi:hypothetical protein
VRTNCIPIYLPPDVYARLERDARANERDPVQQARWILKQGLPPERAGALPADDRPTTDQHAAPAGA